MKACRHFQRLGLETHIVPAGKPWNAWIVVYEGGREILSSFETGLMWRYVEHLLNNQRCMEELQERFDEEFLLDQRNMILSEWEAVAGR
jgi:hypothetical protein